MIPDKLSYKHKILLRPALVSLGKHVGKRYASQDTTSAAHEFADAAMNTIDAVLKILHDDAHT